MTEYIRFLKNTNCPKSYIQRCGDGCCSWLEWENTTFYLGEEVENNDLEVDISNLEEGVDYEIIKN